MAHLVASTTLTDAWCRGLAHLVAHGGEAYDLLVETADPSPERGDARVYETLDAFLAVGLMQSVTTVANTIFPYGLSRSCGGREELYRRYGQLLRRLHRLGANRHGLYFERLTAYPLQGDDPRKANQLELMIARLQDELSRSGGLRHAYELAIHAPGIDTRPMGFPCLSALSFHVEEGRLRLAATYRNQYYITKALGNFVGLARLQGFVAAAVGLPVAALSVHAFHAQVDPDVAKGDVARLTRSLPAIRALETVEP